jgi:hypothetical protein
MQSNQRLTAAEAAKFKKVAYSTFIYHVNNGDGPAFERIGKWRVYTQSDLESWNVPAPKKRGPKTGVTPA